MGNATETEAPVKAPRKPTSLRRRYGHRGWSVDNCTIPRNMKAFPGGFAAKDGALKEFPSPLIWPKFTDLPGAIAMIDAVMARDFGTLRNLRAEYPAHVFGFEAWMDSAVAKGADSDFPMRSYTLKSTPLPRGFQLDVDAVEISRTCYELQFVLRKGDVVIKRELIAKETMTPDSVSLTAPEGVPV